MGIKGKEPTMGMRKAGRRRPVYDASFLIVIGILAIPPPLALANASDQPGWSTLNCEILTAWLEVPSSHLKPFLPEGYQPRSSVGLSVGANAGVRMQVFDCESVTLMDGTVVSPARWAVTEAKVAVNATISGGVALHFYLLEIQVADPTLLDAFLTNGYSATLAEVSIDLSYTSIVETPYNWSPSGAGTWTGNARILADGNLVYELSGEGASVTSDTTYDPGPPTRHHQVGNTGEVLWWDHPPHPEEYTSYTVGKIDVQGGILQQIPPGTLGTMASLTLMAWGSSPEFVFGGL